MKLTFCIFVMYFKGNEQTLPFPSLTEMSPGKNELLKLVNDAII